MTGKMAKDSLLGVQVKLVPLIGRDIYIGSGYPNVDFFTNIGLILKVICGKKEMLVTDINETEYKKLTHQIPSKMNE